MRIKDKYIKSLLAAATLAAGITAFASPASALETEVDGFAIDGNGFDFGGPFWEDGTPTGDAVVSWNRAWYGGVFPSVIGTLHFKNVGGDCARIRLISYDINGSELGRDFSDTECAADNGHDSAEVDELGEMGAASVIVTLQSENAGGWSNVGSATLEHGPIVDSDPVTISRATFDFGDGSLVAGSPAEAGELTWTVSNGSTMTPRLVGELFINDTDTCARMRMGSYAMDGSYLGTVYGATRCGVNDELTIFHVDLEGEGHSLVAEVRLSIQQFTAGPNGAWVQVGATTEYQG